MLDEKFYLMFCEELLFKKLKYHIKKFRKNPEKILKSDKSPENEIIISYLPTSTTVTTPNLLLGNMIKTVKI